MVAVRALFGGVQANLFRAQLRACSAMGAWQPQMPPWTVSGQRRGVSVRMTPPPEGNASDSEDEAMAMGEQVVFPTIGPEKQDPNDLEIKDPKLIFQNIMEILQKKYGRENLRFPKEILWLAGAPASGKGTNTPLIMRERDFTAEPIVVSSLLNSPEMRKLKEEGQLIGDAQVISSVLEHLLRPIYKESGVVVDGFPRTRVQAEVIRMLHNEMHHLREEFFHSPVGPLFRRPQFRLIVLYVGERVSVERQLSRYKQIEEKNKELLKARELGLDVDDAEVEELRATDANEAKARERYRLFKEETYDSLQSLRDKFPFSFINAEGTFQEVEEAIQKEFQYQSELELGPATYEALQALPLASDVIRHARQNLVRRLDSYQNRETTLFQRVMMVIQNDFVHIIRRQALSGKAIIRTENPVFRNPKAVDMALDILSERGYFTVLDSEKRDVPYAIDTDSNTILSERIRTFHFIITFPRPRIRRPAAKR